MLSQNRYSRYVRKSTARKDFHSSEHRSRNIDETVPAASTCIGCCADPLIAIASRMNIDTHARDSPSMRCSTALFALIFASLSSAPASACCLTDWLYGRATSPYVVGYAPYAYAPATPYAAGYAGTTTTSVLRPSWGSTAPVLNNGTYLSQRPAYYDNPSVYTGLPVSSTYQANRIPVASNFRGNAAAPGAYLSAANQYPSNYVSAYGSAQVPVTGGPSLPLSVTTPTGAPPTALPATTAAPLFAPTPPSRGGLGRFFGSMFGTNYRSSYFRAPVTYYRPATTVDPISGTTVTVQQPCTSYVQQLQRTPYSGLQAPTATVPANPACSAPVYGNTMTAPPAQPTFGSPTPAGIGQVGSTAPNSPGMSTVPIPSTIPATPGFGNGGAGGFVPNTAPLTGTPGSQPPAGDQAPVDRPEILNRPPSNGSQSQPAPNETDSEPNKPKSYWELQNAEDSTAMIRNSNLNRYRAEPITAPDEYDSPFRRQLESQTTPVNSRDLRERADFSAPPLPANSKSSIEPAYDTNWISAPVREASSLQRTQYRSRMPKPIQRDMTWKPARSR